MTTHYSYGDFLSIVFVNVYQRLVVILQQWFHFLPSCSIPTTLKNHGVSSSVGARWHSQLNGKVIKFHGSKAPTRYICVYSFHKKKEIQSTNQYLMDILGTLSELFQWEGHLKERVGESEWHDAMKKKKPSSEDKRDITDSLFTFFGGKQFSNDDKVW